MAWEGGRGGGEAGWKIIMISTSQYWTGQPVLSPLTRLEAIICLKIALLGTQGQYFVIAQHNHLTFYGFFPARRTGNSKMEVRSIETHHNEIQSTV